MPITPFSLQPGLYTEGTSKDALGRWREGNNVRWNRGIPQKIGGAVHSTDNLFEGICRGILNWLDLDSVKYLAIGTTRHLYVYNGGEYTDITPLRDSTSAPFSSTQLNGPFDTTATSSFVNVNHTGHGVETNATVSFDNATASPIDGITIDGPYDVVSVTDPDNFVIDSGVIATNSEAGFGGATVDYDYQINPGGEDTMALFGYGSDGYGEVGYGLAGSSSPETAPARVWILDHFGEDLLACFQKSTLYTWDTSAGISAGNIATGVTNAPENINFFLVSPEDRTVIAFGCNDPTSGDFDPLLIRWTDRETMTVWAVTDTNTAGGVRLGIGSEIVGAVKSRGQMLVFTDSSVHSMYPTQDDFIYGFAQLGEGCGLIAPHAVVEKDGRVMWMTKNNLYIYDGIVRVLPCEVWSFVFKNINLDQKVKFHAGIDNDFNEAWFFYATADSTEINKVVIYNFLEEWWALADFAYTAFASDDEIFTTPNGTTDDGQLWDHEVGVDKQDDPLTSHLKSYHTMLDEGNAMMHIRRLIPDFATLDGSIDVSMDVKKYPMGDVSITKGPRTITSGTRYINLRARGRMIALELSTTDVGDNWIMGTWEAQAYPHGAR